VASRLPSRLGNVFLTGYFAGTIDVGAGPIQSAGTDMLVAAFDPAGVLLWSYTAGSYGEQATPMEIAVDAGGSCVVTGYFTGTMGSCGNGLASSGNNDSFLLKFAP
jgi:hypothetical protein